MRKATILFADNDPDFLATRAEVLEQEGYHVVPAANPTEARNRLELGEIDLAIVDIRLTDDDDEKDTSGLALAQEVARSVPKVILTGFPSYQFVRQALQRRLDGLPAAVDFVAKEEGTEALLKAVTGALRRQPSGSSTKRRVFVVHGHDGEAKEAVARFVQGLQLEAVILHEQPDWARALMEKFKQFSNVGFAVVLLTPDDFGGSRKEPGVSLPRARQNVIFEMGYLMARLGPKRVCALRKDQVDVPSDLHGVTYIVMDAAEGWKLPLARALRAASIPFNPNDVF